MQREFAGEALKLVPNIAGVETPCNGGIGGAFDDGSAVGEESHLVRVGPELQDEIVVPHRTMRFRGGR